jgi:uncharacterized RDD family membrane protein YckC
MAAPQGGRAGFVSRVLAAVIDLCLLWLIGLAILLLASLVRYLLLGPPFAVSNPPPDVLTPISFVVGVVYLSYFWGTSGRTPGQQLFGLRVVARGGGGIHAIRAIVRSVLCLVFPLGLLWVLVSRWNVSLQDLVLRSAVVYDWGHRAAQL